mgnify:CR=1 FL=1
MTRALRSSAVVVGGAALALLGSLPAAQAAEQGPARNVILLIGDGMGVTHVDAARQRIVGADGKLSMEQLANNGSVSTYSVEKGTDKPNPVPDSAATSTAWSSGVKSYNGAIGKDAYGEDVVLLMEQAKAAGLRTGNVSTAEITDATPAGAMAHTFKRQCQGPTQSGCAEGEAHIAHQISRNGTADILLGGGLRRFEPDDQAALEEQGYTVLGDFGDENLPNDSGAQTADTQQVATSDDLAAVPAGTEKLVGLFNRGNLTVEKSKAAAAPASAEAEEPTLPEMTAKAIELLSAPAKGQGKGAGNRPGFFLQVESALIDKRSHANDAAQTLEEMRYFDQAVQVAREFAASKEGKGTLVVVSADHECAGFNIIGKGSFANAEAANPPGNVDSSNEANTSTPRREYAGNVLDPQRSTGIVNGAGSADPGNFAPATFRTPEDPAGVQDGDPEASLWLTYVSGNHTGANVPVLSEGPGAAMLDGRVDQTDLYRAMSAALRGVA